jgi:hypothetical protein
MVTRDECARLLKCLNVAFVPSETGGFNCRADDIIGMSKAVVNYMALTVVTQTITGTTFPKLCASDWKSNVSPLRDLLHLISSAA